ncbi:alpha/beta hydrolase [Marinimicrobium locisalis]|uniref:alpha/beta hydrolase n=1 Tax=Marinimicrobium locisalis TaxID=546022 RepID=UPI0032216439
MKRLLMRQWAVGLLCAFAALASAHEIDVRTNVGLTPAHSAQNGVPRGTLKGPFEFHSEIFEGTVRRYWVFVPAQYDGNTPASLLVFQDGQRATNPDGSLRVPQVMENLIAQRAMPVTIGLFVTPGHLADDYPTDLGMSNPNHRAEEYDALNDRYARMLIDELIPLLEADYRLTDDPQQRAIGGTSSGAIAAFTAAWERPDYFRKVFSGIGSYVSIGFKPHADPIRLGGQDYPALIRREPIRPLRLFFQDGTNDLDNEWGNWFMANQRMVAALGYANRTAETQEEEGPRYEFTHVWTDGGHSDEHPGALLPEGLRWLWKQEKGATQ